MQTPGADSLPKLPASRQPFRQTTVQMRLAILLAAMLMAGILTGGAWYYGNQRHIFLLREDYGDEKQDFVSQIANLKSERLHTFVIENTYWDEAIAFLRTHDRQWARINFDGPAEASGASFLHVYDRDGDLVYSWTVPHLTTPEPAADSLSAALPKLGHVKMLRWFVAVGPRVWEMHGATITTGKDQQHKGAFYGYMIAGRPCDQTYVDDISRVARCHLRVPVPNGYAKDRSRLVVAGTSGITGVDISTVNVAIPLYGFNGKPVATLRGVAENPLAPAIDQSTREAISIFVVFGVSIFALTLVVLTKWLNAPIRLLSDALVHRDAERLTPLLAERTEFGFIAQFVAAFFKQESAMLGSQEELEGRVADRTAELAHRAYHDALTGLPNRALFSEHLDTALARAHRSDTGIAVLFVDLDDFKIVNDSLGHEIGDGLLCAAARRMQDCMPADAIIARFGGDEFAILLDETTEAKTRADAERLAAVMRNPFLIAGHTLCTTASIGVASGRDETSPGNVLRNADIAMYDAKAQLRSRDRSFYSMFDRRMLRKAEERLELEAALRTAMRQGGDAFHLVYQPIYDIQTGRLSGMEALMRWEHPSRGTVPPNNFIPLAEETGLIHEMTEWVLREACRCHIMLQKSLPNLSRPAYVSVNFSAVVLQSEGMAAHILRFLRSHGLSPSHLAVEVTESVIARQSTTVLSVLSELRAAGVRVLMDDFGTGYSSLASLMDLPVDIIKIDRAFVADLEKRPATRAILRAIIALAGALQKGVICEGIERREQRDILVQMGCLYGQGYLFSAPLRRPELIEHLISAHPMSVQPSLPERSSPDAVPTGEVGFSAGIPPTTFATSVSNGPGPR